VPSPAGDRKSKELGGRFTFAQLLHSDFASSRRVAKSKFLPVLFALLHLGVKTHYTFERRN
jgi:hypothetical protein